MLIIWLLGPLPIHISPTRYIIVHYIQNSMTAQRRHKKPSLGHRQWLDSSTTLLMTKSQSLKVREAETDVTEKPASVIARRRRKSRELYLLPAWSWICPPSGHAGPRSPPPWTCEPSLRRRRWTRTLPAAKQCNTQKETTAKSLSIQTTRNQGQFRSSTSSPRSYLACFCLIWFYC